jgi:hypothetical protein
MIRAALTAGTFALTLTVSTVVLADEEPEPPRVASVVYPVAPKKPAQQTDLEERLEFLSQRIGTQYLHAQIWWGSWLGFYSAGALFQSVRAGMATDRAEQADLVVSVVKATGGVVRYIVDPMKGIEDFEPAPGETKAEQVARGERILRNNAEATTPFGPWYAHLINLGINGTGAVIVGAGFDDWKTGLISAGIGFAVGEVSLLTQPWEADKDLEEYETRYGAGQPVRKTSEVKWTFVPTVGGAGFNASF